MPAPLGRRRFLKLGGFAVAAAASAAALPACAGPGLSGSGSSNTLNINSFGGTFQDAIQRQVATPFEAARSGGLSVALTTAISSEALTQLKGANGGVPPFDVAYMDLAVLYQAKAAGLLQPIDRTKVPSISELYPLAVDENGYWVAELASMTGIAYNTEQVTTPPTSWAQLWDPAYAGKVAISNVSGTAGYQFLAMAARLNGGDESRIDPGFAAVSRLKPNIASIYNTPDEMSKLLSGGEAWLGPWYADRTSALKKSGAPVAFVQPSEGAIAVLSAMCIPKGTTKLDDAHSWIDFQISAKINAAFVQAIAEGPTNRTVQLDQSYRDNNYLPYGEDEISSLVALDNGVISASLADWVSRWQQEIAN
jgi:putative spermidine/putrescine transport system substrate-binding protein